MPCDVAMERPHARVICLVLEHDIPWCARCTTLHELHITTLRVGLMGDLAVPGSDALGQDVEIMAMKMHRVGGRELVLDNEPDGAVVTKVVDVPLGVVWVREVALIG